MDHRIIAFYRWEVEAQGSGRRDDDAVEWDPLRPLHPLVELQLKGSGNALSYWRMIRRWRTGLIRFFSLMIDGHPACLGAIHNWSLQRRELSWLKPVGGFLGPFWTDPAYRGRGLYPRLLLHTVCILAEMGMSQIYIASQASNIPSRKGIERAGFRAIGCREVRRSGFRLLVHSVPAPKRPARVT